MSCNDIKFDFSEVNHQRRSLHYRRSECHIIIIIMSYSLVVKILCFFSKNNYNFWFLNGFLFLTNIEIFLLLQCRKIVWISWIRVQKWKKTWCLWFRAVGLLYEKITNWSFTSSRRKASQLWKYEINLACMRNMTNAVYGFENM